MRSNFLLEAMPEHRRTQPKSGKRRVLLASTALIIGLSSIGMAARPAPVEAWGFQVKVWSVWAGVPWGPYYYKKCKDRRGAQDFRIPKSGLGMALYECYDILA